MDVARLAAAVETPSAAGALFAEAGALQLPDPAAPPQAQRPPGRPVWLLPMHVWTATMQGLDAHSTFEAHDAGGTEANPIVPFDPGEHRAAFVALKVGVAAGLIYYTEKDVRRHPWRAAIITAAVNSAYLAIVAHNYRIAREGQ
jgi:hypothetical protein